MSARVAVTPGELAFLAVTLFFCLFVSPVGVLLAGFGAWDRRDHDRPVAFALLVTFAALGAVLSILPLLTGG